MYVHDMGGSSVWDAMLCSVAAPGSSARAGHALAPDRGWTRRRGTASRARAR